MTETGSFWAWSVTVYERPGVAAACLALQDRQGVDVNLLLLGLWLATHGQTLSPETAAELAACADTWQREVVRPLRGVRRILKRRQADAAAAELHRDVAAAELRAEQLEQAELERQVRERTLAAPPTRATAQATWSRLIPHTTLDAQSTLPLLSAVFGAEGGCAERG